MANKVVGGEHHFADITVKTRFMPVLTVTKNGEIFNDTSPKAVGVMIFKRG